MGLGSFFKRNKENKTEDVTEDCHIDINADDCDGCEKCSIACPNNVFIIVDEASSVRDAQVCRRCRVCVAICPNDCITVN